MEKKKTDWTGIIAICVFITVISCAIYTCNHQYTDFFIERKVVIRSEVVKDEMSGHASVQRFYVLCSDSAGKVYRFSESAFKAYPNSLPGDSFLMKIKMGIPTRWATGPNSKDTIVIEAEVLKQLK